MKSFLSQLSITSLHKPALLGGVCLISSIKWSGPRLGQYEGTILKGTSLQLITPEYVLCPLK